MNKLSTVVGAMSCLLACAAVHSPSQSNAQQPPASRRVEMLEPETPVKYFPLAIGNTWVWPAMAGIPPYDSVETIIDTVQRRGATYFRFNHFREIDSPLVRLNEKQQLLIYTDSTDVVWFDFGADSGAQWFTPVPGHWIVWHTRLAGKHDTVSVGPHQFDSCCCFEYGGLRDYGWTEWLAPNAGPIRRVVMTFGGPLAYVVHRVRINDADVITAVAADEARSPAVPWLVQNYPNPFNAGTTIEFGITHRTEVELRVVDLLGRDISTLVKEELLPGTYRQRWNVSGLPSGVYYCRLRAGESLCVRRMVLLR